jgi:hypothetical protein
MKKLTLTIGCALAMAGAASAQGLINWTTSAGANFVAQTNSSPSTFFGGSGTGGTAAYEGQQPSGAALYYALLYGSQNTTGTQVAAPSSLAALSSWTSTGLMATNGVSANGRIQYVSPSAGATLPWGGNTDVNGQSNNIVMVGWSANIGAAGSGLETWANVINVLNSPTLLANVIGNAFFGVSSTGFLVGNDSPASGASWFSATQGANGLPLYQPSGNPMQLYLVPVPEPCSLALAGLGGLSLMLFRRQRK